MGRLRLRRQQQKGVRKYPHYRLSFIIRRILVVVVGIFYYFIYRQQRSPAETTASTATTDEKNIWREGRRGRSVKSARVLRLLPAPESRAVSLVVGGYGLMVSFLA